MHKVIGFLTQHFTYEDIRDAEDALHYENHVRCQGRELDVQFAEGDRKSECSLQVLFFHFKVYLFLSNLL